VLTVENNELIRKLVLIEGLSQNEVAKKLRHSKRSVKQALENPDPRGYSLSAPRRSPVADSVRAIVERWLQEDKSKPRKQRHTQTRIFERLRDEYQFTGSLRTISTLVKTLQAKPPEVFCPIDHPPGDEVQIDWGQAIVKLAGEEAKVMIFCARSAYSKATFVRAYMRDDMVSFLDAHVHMFTWLGGVPSKLAYDNLKTAVTHVYTGKNRQLTNRFMALRSHYLFQSRFCNVASGNEKGHVENSVKRAERTYLTPIPQVASREALNEHLSHWTERDLKRIDKDTGRTYGQLFEEERKQFRALPVTPFAACISNAIRIDKRATVPCGQSRYSVPVEYATQHATVRAFIDRVEVLCDNKIIAIHERVQPGEWSLQVAHYIALLETKPGLLDSGKPFAKQAWTRNQELFRNELEYRYEGEGTRRFIDILLLVKHHDWSDVCRAIDACCKNHAFSEAAVLMELGRIENSNNTTLDLNSRPELVLPDCQGLRSAAYYESLIALPEQQPQAESQGALSCSVIESSVTSTVARSAQNVQSQVQQERIDTGLSSSRVTPPITEVACDAQRLLASCASL
jgi:transposase